MPEIGQFFWNELNANDVEKAQEFYSETNGWTFEAIPTPDGGPYWLAKQGVVPVAGIIPHVGSKLAPPQDFWTPYLAVENVRKKTETAVSKGAQIVRPLWEVPQVGLRVVLREPGGAVVAWITPLGE